MSDQPALDELQWKNPEWIQSFGLNTGNVLEYFSESPFFDRRANNQTVKMQMQFQAGIQMDSTMIEKEMKKLTGLEYVIHLRREPDFWVLRKQNRLSPDRVEPLADYFVIGANVYMAPTAKDIVSSRLLSSALSLKHAINNLQTLAQFTPSDGHTYKNQSTTDSSASRPRTIAYTPYTPSTPTVSGPGGFSKSEQLSRTTIDNLFNISLNGIPTYVDAEKDEQDEGPLTPVQKPIGRPKTDEETINSVKKGKRAIK
ncbi:CYFA0S17e01134g1_1 [Cyberlindnera fabianii]|uniref:Mediator of RNA polymerase II transcription subunit 6 n=1 Tax=Cyberlindnera fabianii TaxID=36022 RepID=A0A061BBP2_CYBFA|nr:CYFA0S17e01134g1_1 [Cyberlindnera fabianii]